MNAKELMSSIVVVVPPEMPVTALAELLAARGISAVPVVDAQGTPLGIVTLYGYARSETMRQGLMVLAKAVPGVTAVRDKPDPMPLLLRGTF